MKRATSACAIIGPRGQLHVDKIMRSRKEAWGLLAEELSIEDRFCVAIGEVVSERQRSVAPYKPAEMQRLGYFCRRVRITWETKDEA